MLDMQIMIFFSLLSSLSFKRNGLQEIPQVVLEPILKDESLPKTTRGGKYSDIGPNRQVI